MKVTIRNLGVIREAEFDLKPLTVFVGPNNSGKTWLAYTLVGILGTYGMDKYVQAYANSEFKEYPLLDSAIERVLAKDNATIDLYKFAEEYGEKYFQNVADLAYTWMQDFMKTQLAVFNNIKVSISLADKRAEFLERIEKTSLPRKIYGGTLDIRKSQGDKILYAFTSIEGEGEEQITDRLPAGAIKEHLVQSVARVLHRSLYPQVRVFPTERTTLVTFRFGGRTRASTPFILDEKTQPMFDALSGTLQQLQELSGLSISTMIEQNSRVAIEPVASFMRMMSSIFRFGSKELERRNKDAQNDPRIQKYIDFARVLERQILTGGLDFSTPEPDPRRDIHFQPVQDVALEIPIASSMVKELSPLVLYLRYLAKPGELLIIDEPEMNLHPEAQAKVIEFLTMLVNAGLNVLVTTHSTYVVDHLINLMDAAKHEDKEEIADLFFLKRTDAFIPKDNVSVYLIDPGKENQVENILDEDGIIHWDTFSDVTYRVTNIHFKL